MQKFNLNVDLQRIRNKVHGLSVRDQTIFELLRTTPIPVVELINLNIRNINLAKKLIFVSNSYDQFIYFKLSEELVDLLNRLLDVPSEHKDQALFLSDKGTRLTLDELWKITINFGVSI